MTRPKDMSRRSFFFGLARRPLEPAPRIAARFSLEDFYRKRRRDGASRSSLPPIERRPEVAKLDIPTTHVGEPSLRRRR